MWATTALTACASNGTRTDVMSVDVPANLAAPAGQVRSLEVTATGVQIYQCGAAAGANGMPTKFEWVFQGPEAELFNAAGTKIGKHYGGPTWESNDGSTVVGEVKARADGPDASAIAWLLLSAKSNQGLGVFGKTLSIQRVSTVGGKAPASGCDAATVGAPARVAYKATYFFYAKAG
jgi:Protein of unknown function (DUF3455)